MSTDVNDLRSEYVNDLREEIKKTIIKTMKHYEGRLPRSDRMLGMDIALLINVLEKFPPSSKDKAVETVKSLVDHLAADLLVEGLDVTLEIKVVTR